MTTLLTGPAPEDKASLRDGTVDIDRDRVLVERAQRGDPAAFDDLYQRYYHRLYRFCVSRLRDGHDAEDVAQETFARAWRALPGFGGERRFYPWLRVIASNLCTDLLRRRNRTTPVADFYQANVASTEEGAEERAVAAVDSDLVTQALGRLSDRHQRILNLREGAGWSYQMIADHEGIGITATETLLWRARQALKREFALLAGPDGSLAGVLGAMLGIAALRRWLRGPLTAARNLAPGGAWSTAAAVSSAVAAVSVVVIAGAAPGILDHPTAASPPTVVAAQAPTAGHGEAARTALRTAKRRAVPVSAGHSSRRAAPVRTTIGQAPLSDLPAAVSDASAGGERRSGVVRGVTTAVDDPASAARALGSTVRGLQSTVYSAGSAIGDLTATIGALADPASGAGGALDAFGTAVQNAGNTLSTLGAQASDLTSSALSVVATVDRAASGSAAAVSSLTDVADPTASDLPRQASSADSQAADSPASALAAPTTTSSSSGGPSSDATDTSPTGAAVASASSAAPSAVANLSSGACDAASTVESTDATLGSLGTLTAAGPDTACSG